MLEFFASGILMHERCFARAPATCDTDNPGGKINPLIQKTFERKGLRTQEAFGKLAYYRGHFCSLTIK
jgi:hypothetical protein